VAMFLLDALDFHWHGFAAEQNWEARARARSTRCLPRAKPKKEMNKAK